LPDSRDHNLEEDLRLDAKTADMSRIRVGRVKRSANISFIKADC